MPESRFPRTDIGTVIERSSCAGDRCLAPVTEPGSRFCIDCLPVAISRGRRLRND